MGDSMYLIENFSLAYFLMSLAIFGLTALFKLPLKRFTARYSDTTRQALNSLIILIPLLLSFIVVGVYYCIKDLPLLSLDYASSAMSVCIMSISIYLVLARLLIIGRGILRGITKIEDPKIQEQVQEIVEDISTALTHKDNVMNSNTTDNISRLKAQMSALHALKVQMNNIMDTQEKCQKIDNATCEETQGETLANIDIERREND